MARLMIFLPILFLLVQCTSNKENPDDAFRQEVQQYLNTYDSTYQQLAYISSQASWKLNTMIMEGDTMTAFEKRQAEESFAEFVGSVENIDKATSFLKSAEKLNNLQQRQLKRILFNAAPQAQTSPETVKELIAMETAQVEKLFGFDFKVSGKSVSTNDIDRLLSSSENIAERLNYWQASKEVGIGLKDGLDEARHLRNKVVQSLNYPDYFSYNVTEYEMTATEMLEMNKQLISDIWPLYRELHTWARYTLAEKYKQPVPKMIPAHWLPNRWGQQWTDMVNVQGLDINPALGEKSAEWVVQKGEDFYVSLGFDKLPPSFYEKSSLYPLPEGTPYKKNNHASAWHLDLANDVRSLMSVEPNADWWETTLHELGHIYYYMCYTNDSVPVSLRRGANRAYHEAVGSLIGLASLQQPFLVQMGLADENAEVDSIQSLLKEAVQYIVFIPWSSGVMTEFEYELYSNNLPKDQFNQKWWELKRKYQGIVPPSERGENYCDAASKTHIINDVAEYYDYALSFVLLFQFHDYIAKQILKQDPHATNYYGNKEVGNFLKKLLTPGATVDWRKHLMETIGSEISAKPMLDYFAPLMKYLKDQNKDREYTLPETI